jgi:hypothetical protein
MFRVSSRKPLHEYGIEPSQTTEEKINTNKCPHGSVRISPKRTVYPFGIIPEAVQQKQNAKKMQTATQAADEVAVEEVSTPSPGMKG